MAGKASSLPKDAQDHIPFAADQGMKNLAGAYARGLSFQQLLIAMPSDGVINFAANGLSDMAVAEGYGLYIHNHSDAADEATVERAVRLTDKFTITGPDTGDVLDILIVGQLAGQLA